MRLGRPLTWVVGSSVEPEGEVRARAGAGWVVAAGGEWGGAGRSEDACC